MKLSYLPNWMKSAMQRDDSCRESLCVNKERPRPPAGGVSWNRKSWYLDDLVVVFSSIGILAGFGNLGNR